LRFSTCFSKQESQRWSTVGDSKKAKDGAILYS
jgi:hypothetical protein